MCHENNVKKKCNVYTTAASWLKGYIEYDLVDSFAL